MSDVVYFNPRTGEEVSRSCGGAPIYLYSELAEEMKRGGAFDVLCNIMRRSLKNFILVQDPDEMTSGHWTALEFVPDKQEVYFFSSYGGKPDEEKNKWIPFTARSASGQVLNVLNDGLKEFAKRGWTVHYSQYKYQVPGDDTATCGIWASAFMNSGLNPDEFHRTTKRRRLTAKDYFDAYF